MPGGQFDTGQHEMLLGRITARLGQEFGAQFSPDTLSHYVQDSYEQLRARSRVLTHLPAFVERFARQRLQALAKHRGLVRDHPPVALFVCQHNSAASQAAAALFEHHAGGRATALSAGVDPADELDAASVEALHELGIDSLGAFPKPLTDEVERAADIIVTLDAHDVVTILDDRMFLAWDVPATESTDPEGARRMLEFLDERIARLVAEVVPPAQPVIRHAFDDELRDLGQRIGNMGDLVLEMLHDLAELIRHPSAGGFDDLAGKDDAVDMAQVEVEIAVAALITRRQPVAVDLRRLLATLQAGIHLERIGDGALEAAAGIGLVDLDGDTDMRARLVDMVGTVAEMTSAAMAALADGDEAAARHVEEMDDALDRSHDDLFESLAAGSGEGTDVRALLRIDRTSRSLERAGDHAVDIAELAAYLDTGLVTDLTGDGVSG